MVLFFGARFRDRISRVRFESDSGFLLLRYFTVSGLASARLFSTNISRSVGLFIELVRPKVQIS